MQSWYKTILNYLQNRSFLHTNLCLQNWVVPFFTKIKCTSNVWVEYHVAGRMFVVWIMMNRDGGRARTNSLVVEDLGVTSVGVFPSQLPHIKERLPVDEVHQTVQVVPLKHTGAQELRTHWNTNAKGRAHVVFKKVHTEPQYYIQYTFSVSAYSNTSLKLYDVYILKTDTVSWYLWCNNDFGIPPIPSCVLTYLAWAERASLYVKPSLWPGRETGTGDPDMEDEEGGKAISVI